MAVRVAEEIRVWATAIVRKTASRPTRLAWERGLIRGKVLDYGCGYGADVRWLKGKGVDVEGYDPYFPEWDINITGKLYDTILLNYVLNVLPPEERRAVASDAVAHLKPGGTIIVGVRMRDEIERLARRYGWMPHEDGYLTGTHTF